jgi:predicted ABC-type ATPase
MPQRMKGSKKIVIIAGPNGAGKTTFAREFLPQEADCPDWALYDNSESTPRLIVSKDNT